MRHFKITLISSILALAIGISYFSYHYFELASSQINEMGTEDRRIHSRIQTKDLAQALSSEVDVAESNLQILANAPSIQLHEFEEAKTMINAAEDSGSTRLVQFYMWLDQYGKIVWISNMNQSMYEQFYGFDLSYRPYFITPKQTLQPYSSSTIESNDRVPRLYLSYPIIIDEIEAEQIPSNGANFNSSDGIQQGGIQENQNVGQPLFGGVMVAGIRIDDLGVLIRDRLIPEVEGDLFLTDKDGKILYASSSQSGSIDTAIGKDLQSYVSRSLTEASRRSLDDLIQISLNKEHPILGDSNSGDSSTSNDGSNIAANGVSSGPVIQRDLTTLQGEINTISYRPVLTNQEDFLNLYLIGPHNFAGVVSNLIGQLKTFSIGITAAIGITGVIVAVIVLSWNRRLEKIVKARTRELEIRNERLKQNDKMQKEFINIAAHELRTPIQPILGLSDIVYKGSENKQQRERLDVIFRNARRLQRLSEAILDVSKIESDSLSLNKSDFSLTDLINQVVTDFRREIIENNKESTDYHEDHIAENIAGVSAQIQIKYRDVNSSNSSSSSFISQPINGDFELSANQTIMVRGDRERISQVISNLLSNALKFTKEGNVTVSTEILQESKEVLVRIRDTGDGIDPRIIPRLFTKFATTSFEGTGLGLYISKKIIEAHGGRIWAEDNDSRDKDGIKQKRERQETKGATFYFTLPYDY